MIHYRIIDNVCNATLFQYGESRRKVPVWYESFGIPLIMKKERSEVVECYALFTLLRRLSRFLESNRPFVLIMEESVLEHLKSRRAPIPVWRQEIMRANFTILNPKIFKINN